MLRFKYAVLWEFAFIPRGEREYPKAVIGTNVFSLEYCIEDAEEKARELQAVGHSAWVEEL